MGFLRNVFGPSRNEIWQQFASAIGGSFTEGGFWNGGTVEAAHGQWIITLDTYTVSTGKSSITYTRIRAPWFPAAIWVTVVCAPQVPAGKSAAPSRQL